MLSMKSRWALLGAAFAFGVAGIAPVAVAADEGDGAPAKAAKKNNNLYIVRMVDSPVVAYTGGIPGLQATKPRKGSKIDPDDPKVVRYATYLEARPELWRGN